MSGNTITVRFFRNGLQTLTVEQGTTLAELLAQQLDSPEDYSILFKGEAYDPSKTIILNDGDRITATLRGKKNA
jgi:sulfur carrier protein ThiS